MKLFNKYQSRALQFVLDLLAQLQSTALSTSQIQALAQQWGLDYADQVLPQCRFQKQLGLRNLEQCGKRAPFRGA